MLFFFLKKKKTAQLGSTLLSLKRPQGLTSWFVVQNTCPNACILLSIPAYHKSDGKEDMLPPPSCPVSTTSVLLGSRIVYRKHSAQQCNSSASRGHCSPCQDAKTGYIYIETQAKPPGENTVSYPWRKGLSTACLGKQEKLKALGIHPSHEWTLKGGNVTRKLENAVPSPPTRREPRFPLSQLGLTKDGRSQGAINEVPNPLCGVLTHRGGMSCPLGWFSTMFAIFIPRCVNHSDGWGDRGRIYKTGEWRCEAVQFC